MVLKFDTFKLLIYLIAVLKKNGNDTCFVYCICTLLIKITILIPMYQYNVKYCKDELLEHKTTIIDILLIFGDATKRIKMYVTNQLYTNISQ